MFIKSDDKDSSWDLFLIFNLKNWNKSWKNKQRESHFC